MAVIYWLSIQNANVEAQEFQKFTPLHMACGNGHVEIAQMLLDQNVDLEAKISTGWTPLQLKADCGYTRVAQLLIHRGANLDAKDEYELTAVHIA